MRTFTRRCTQITLLTSLFLARTAAADPSSTTLAKGYDGGGIQHPRQVAMGGALAASGASTTAIFYNPANLALARVQHFEGLAALGVESRRQSYGGAIADSYTNRVAGGVSGMWNSLDADGVHRIWTDFRLGLGFQLSDKVLVGAAGKYQRINQTTSGGPFGQSAPSSGTPDSPLVQSFTFDAGITVLPVSGLSIGLTGRNLTVPDNALMPTQVQGGIAYTGAAFAIEADGMADFHTFGKTKGRYMIGGEAFVVDKFPVRAGYQYDDGTKTHTVSGGIGYVEQAWSIELGVKRDVAGDRPATLGVLGLRVFYDQLGGSGGISDPMGNYR